MLEEATNNGMVSDSSVGIGLLRWVSDSSVGIGLSDNVVSEVTETSNVCIFIQTFDVFRADGYRPLCSKRQRITAWYRTLRWVSDSSVDIGLFGGYRTLRWVSDSSVGIGLFDGYRTRRTLG